MSPFFSDPAFTHQVKSYSNSKQVKSYSNSKEAGSRMGNPAQMQTQAAANEIVAMLKSRGIGAQSAESTPLRSKSARAEGRQSPRCPTTKTLRRLWGTPKYLASSTRHAAPYTGPETAPLRGHGLRSCKRGRSCVSLL
jgi:hypothetical protein